MKITLFHIENFKSIENLKINLVPSLSVLTGVNNGGKTTIIEALALWVECFEKLSHQSKRKVTGKYETGDYVFGTGPKNYLNFSDINSVRSPNFEDIFFDRDIKRLVRLSATIENDRKEKMVISFAIANSTKSRYNISLDNEGTFDYPRLQTFFTKWPMPVKAYFSAPLANVVQEETFVTDPVLQNGLRLRRSSEYIRNRLYRLYHTGETFARFQQDLSYILYGTAVSAKLKFYSKTDVQQDPKVVITYTIGSERIEKDVALLGSGSLQAIEILLDLYHQVNGNHDLNLILLDEPDSHIHRDIQKRLYEVMTRFKNENQIVITTHNESMIRTVPLSCLFHVDVTQRELSCIGSSELEKINQPHFKGLYPALESPVIRDITGVTSGLDFISAIEADKIFFVEGDDDARLLYYLFRLNPANAEKRIMFWVLGGVDKIMTRIEGYYDVFSSVRNGRSLWDKSYLVFDQDCLTDEHLAILKKQLESKYHIKSCVADAYTQESVLLTDLHKLATLLGIHYQLDDSDLIPLEDALQSQCDEELEKLKAMNQCDFEAKIREYLGRYIDHLNNCLDARLKEDGIGLSQKLPKYYSSQPIYKLARKENVEKIINGAGRNIGHDFGFDIESDFYTLVKDTRTDLLFDSWMKVISFMSR